MFGMSQTDQERQYEKILVEIERLPKGYVSKKNIQGKERFYLQWSERGKKKSKYIPNSELSSIENGIQQRKEKEEVLSALKEYFLKEDPDYFKKRKTRTFYTSVKTGKKLKEDVLSVKDFKKRFCYSKLTDFLYAPFKDTHGKVFILYGLRRTGKTTLIKQAILEMDEEDFNKTAFMKINSQNDINEINHDLELLQELGYQYVFLDEITLCKDFIQTASILSDVYATSPMKIILSGTDSLGFLFAEDQELFDRAVFLHTTFIPFSEFSSVLGIHDIDSYIEYGGLMALSGTNYNEGNLFQKEDKTNQYIDSAISRNIQHSLECYEDGTHFRNLLELHEKNELTGAINRVIEDMNHRFTVDVLTRKFFSSDLGISKRNLKKDREHLNDILYRIDEEKFLKLFKDKLEIKEKEEQEVAIQETHVKEIRSYLLLLDLIKDVSIRNEDGSSYKRTIFVQPGMRYSQAVSFVESLFQDPFLQSLSIKERIDLKERILSEIKGRMMEDIILLETSLANPRKEVFKLQFPIGEVDMVIFNEKKACSEIYEIKHSKERDPSQKKNLLDKDKLNLIQHRYGKIILKGVIYRGNSCQDGDISYIPVETYLSSLKFDY